MRARDAGGRAGEEKLVIPGNFRWDFKGADQMLILPLMDGDRSATARALHPCFQASRFFRDLYVVKANEIPIGNPDEELSWAFRLDSVGVGAPLQIITARRNPIVRMEVIRGGGGRELDPIEVGMASAGPVPVEAEEPELVAQEGLHGELHDEGLPDPVEALPIGAPGEEGLPREGRLDAESDR